MERLFALRAEQAVFRRHWLLDLTYFFLNSLLVEVLTLFTLRPALILFDWARLETVQTAVASLPLPLAVAAPLDRRWGKSHAAMRCTRVVIGRVSLWALGDHQTRRDLKVATTIHGVAQPFSS